MSTLTLDDLVARAEQIATGVGTDSSLSVLNDSDLTIEALAEHVLNATAEDWLKDPSKRAQLQQTSSLTFTSGTATIPTGLAEDWPLEADWSSEFDNMAGLVTFCPHRVDAQHHRKAYLFYTWVDGTSIKMIRGTGDNFDGDVSLTAARQPAFSSGTLTAPEHFLDDFILRLSATLRGEIPLSVLAGLSAPAKPKK